MATKKAAKKVAAKAVPAKRSKVKSGPIVITGEQVLEAAAGVRRAFEAIARIEAKLESAGKDVETVVCDSNYKDVDGYDLAQIQGIGQAPYDPYGAKQQAYAKSIGLADMKSRVNPGTGGLGPQTYVPSLGTAGNAAAPSPSPTPLEELIYQAREYSSSTSVKAIEVCALVRGENSGLDQLASSPNAPSQGMNKDRLREAFLYLDSINASLDSIREYIVAN